MSNRKDMSKKGFTLIELMLVVSIVLVLMGFMIPRFSSYQNKVKETKAVSVGKQIQTAAMASYGDNDGEFIKEDVEENIRTLTSSGTATASTGENGQTVDIKYNSDGIDYTLKIDASQDTYEVVKGNKRIFPKAISVVGSENGEDKQD